MRSYCQIFCALVMSSTVCCGGTVEQGRCESEPNTLIGCEPGLDVQVLASETRTPDRLLLTSRGLLDINSTDVYFSAFDGELNRVPKQGGDVESIPMPPSYPADIRLKIEAIVATDKRVYVAINAPGTAAGGWVVARDTAPGSHFVGLLESFFHVIALAGDQKGVYAAVRSGLGSLNLVDISAGRVVAQVEGDYAVLALDAERVYIASGPDFFDEKPPSSDSVSQLAVIPRAHPDGSGELDGPELIVPLPRPPIIYSLAGVSDALFVGVRQGNENELERIDLHDGRVVPFETGDLAPMYFAADSRDLYGFGNVNAPFSSTGGEYVIRYGLDGSRVRLARLGFENPLSMGWYGWSIRADESHVYWLDGVEGCGGSCTSCDDPDSIQMTCLTARRVVRVPKPSTNSVARGS